MIAEASIMATSINNKHHICVVEHCERIYKIASVLCDVDLYAFALPYERYRLTSDQVRQEFDPGNEYLSLSYYIGNVKFMLSYMEKENLFNTPFAQQYWELVARRNMLSIIAEMSVRLQQLTEEGSG